jgi:hypothetical protein
VAVGKPGVPNWVDTAGGPERRSAADDQAVAQEWTAAGRVGGSSRAQATVSRLLAYALWSGIALALVLGLVNCVGRSGGAPGLAADPAPPPAVPPPGGCAELVVAAWLAGDARLLADVPGVPRSQPEPGRRQAGRTFTAAVTPGEDAWGYLVGAEVLVRDERQRWRSAGTQFFTVTMVPISGGCQGWGPAALPAQVPAPTLAGAGAGVYEVSLPSSGTELAATLEAFFAGLLAGAENLERYVAPGVVIPAVVPPPYEQVTVTELRARDDPTDRGTVVPPDGTVVQLLATVSTGADDLPLVYPVTVGVRGGRWEVVAIDPLVGTTAGPAATAGTAHPAETMNGG